MSSVCLSVCLRAATSPVDGCELVSNIRMIKTFEDKDLIGRMCFGCWLFSSYKLGTVAFR